MPTIAYNREHQVAVYAKRVAFVQTPSVNIVEGGTNNPHTDTQTQGICLVCLPQSSNLEGDSIASNALYQDYDYSPR